MSSTGCWPWYSKTHLQQNVSCAEPGISNEILLAALRAMSSRIEIKTANGNVFCNHGDAPRPPGRVLTRTSSLPQGAVMTMWEKDPLVALDDLPIMAWIATQAPSGEWGYNVNSQWTTYSGVSVDKWKETIHPEDAPRTIGGWERALATCTPFEVEARMRRADGEWLWFYYRAVSLYDDAGVFMGYLGIQ